MFLFCFLLIPKYIRLGSNQETRIISLFVMFPTFIFVGPMTWEIVILQIPCIVAKLFENNLPNIVIKPLNISPKS